MPHKCCAPGCHSNYNEKLKATVFSFPKDEQLLEQWLKEIPKDNFQPTKNTRLCEKHFNPEDIITEASAFDPRTNSTITAPLKVFRLKRDAVPSIFPKSIFPIRQQKSPKMKDSVVKDDLSEQYSEDLEHSRGHSILIKRANSMKSQSLKKLPPHLGQQTIGESTDETVDQQRVSKSPTTYQPIITIVKAEGMNSENDEENDVDVEGMLDSPKKHSQPNPMLGNVLLPSPYKNLPTVTVCLKKEDRVIISKELQKSVKRSPSVGSNSSNGSNDTLKITTPPVKRRKIDKPPPSVIGRQNDVFCWICHKEGTVLVCIACPRAFHQKCAGEFEVIADWVCPECQRVIAAENVDTRSSTLSDISLEKLCALLKCSLNKLKYRAPAAFHQPVPLDCYSSYLQYIIHPMDLSLIEKNIKQKLYGCTEAFLADVKWILHNSCVFNGSQHPLSTNAKSLVKTCEYDMQEIEVCPDCFMHGCMRSKYWFSEICRKPHPLVWAKLKGFPHWPAKVARILDGNVDARFFGAHDRAWVSISQCYHLSKEMPTSSKPKKKGTYDNALDELNVHVHLLIQKFGTFEYAPYRTSFDPENKFFLYHGIDIDKISKEEISFDPNVHNNAGELPSPAAPRRLLSKTDSESIESDHNPRKPDPESSENNEKPMDIEDDALNSDYHLIDKLKDHLANADIGRKVPAPTPEVKNDTNVSEEANSNEKTSTDEASMNSNSDTEQLKKLEMALERIKGYISVCAEMDKKDAEKSDEPSSPTHPATVPSEETTPIEKVDDDVGLPEMPLESESSAEEASALLNTENRKDSFFMKLNETIESCKAKLGISEFVDEGSSGSESAEEEGDNDSESSSSDDDDDESGSTSSENEETHSEASDTDVEEADDEVNRELAMERGKADACSSASVEVDSSHPKAIGSAVDLSGEKEDDCDNIADESTSKKVVADDSDNENEVDSDNEAIVIGANSNTKIVTGEDSEGECDKVDEDGSAEKRVVSDNSNSEKEDSDSDEDKEDTDSGSEKADNDIEGGSNNANINIDMGDGGSNNANINIERADRGSSFVNMNTNRVEKIVSGVELENRKKSTSNDSEVSDSRCLNDENENSSDDEAMDMKEKEETFPTVLANITEKSNPHDEEMGAKESLKCDDQSAPLVEMTSSSNLDREKLDSEKTLSLEGSPKKVSELPEGNGNTVTDNTNENIDSDNDSLDIYICESPKKPEPPLILLDDITDNETDTEEKTVGASEKSADVLEKEIAACHTSMENEELVRSESSPVSVSKTNFIPEDENNISLSQYLKAIQNQAKNVNVEECTEKIQKSPIAKHGNVTKPNLVPETNEFGVALPPPINAGHKRRARAQFSKFCVDDRLEFSDDEIQTISCVTNNPLSGAKRTFSQSDSHSSSNIQQMSSKLQRRMSLNLEVDDKLSIDKSFHKKLDNHIDDSLRSILGSSKADCSNIILDDSTNLQLEESEDQIRKMQNEIALLSSALQKQHWAHNQEKAELRHNMNLIIMEMRASLEADKKNTIEILSKQHEREKAKCVEEAKKKQWCASCRMESRYACCWNTSYCTPGCQKRHFQYHMKFCGQLLAQQKNTQSTEVAKILNSSSNTESSDEKPPEKKIILVNMKPSDAFKTVTTRSSSPITTPSVVASEKLSSILSSAQLIKPKPPQIQILTTKGQVQPSSPTSTTSHLQLVQNPKVQFLYTSTKSAAETSPTCLNLPASKIETMGAMADSADIIHCVRKRICGLSTAISLLNMKNEQSTTPDNKKEKPNPKETNLEDIYFPKPKFQIEGYDPDNTETALKSDVEMEGEEVSDLEMDEEQTEDKTEDSTAEEEEIVISEEDEASSEKVSIGYGIEVNAKLLNKCLIFGQTPKKLTRCLVDVLFQDIKLLASCSAFGQKSNITKLTRAALPTKKVYAIIDYVQKRYPNTLKSEITLAINMKCKEARKVIGRCKDPSALSNKKPLLRRLLALESDVKQKKIVNIKLSKSAPSESKATTKPSDTNPVVSNIKSILITNTVTASSAMKSPSKPIHITSTETSSSKTIPSSSADSKPKFVTIPKFLRYSDAASPDGKTKGRPGATTLVVSATGLKKSILPTATGLRQILSDGKKIMMPAHVTGSSSGAQTLFTSYSEKSPNTAQPTQRPIIIVGAKKLSPSHPYGVQQAQSQSPGSILNKDKDEQGNKKVD